MEEGLKLELKLKNCCLNCQHFIQDKEELDNGVIGCSHKEVCGNFLGMYKPVTFTVDTKNPKAKIIGELLLDGLKKQGKFGEVV